jgi:26S proteasome regulatory subunit (ATPase 3-interacting protein)
MEKTYGKQKVYAINQDLVSSPDDLNITEIDAKISELTRQNAEDETFIKKAESELKILNSTLSIAEATSQLKMVFSILFTYYVLGGELVFVLQLCEENETMESKIKDLSQNKVKLSAADFKKACVIKEKTASELRKRKRICGDMLDQILESYPKGKKALLEEVGVETD